MKSRIPSRIACALLSVGGALSIPTFVSASEIAVDSAVPLSALERAAELHSGARSDLVRAQVSALEAEAAERALPPLNISLGLSLLPTETRNGAMRSTASVRQRLPTFAERRALGDVASAASTAAECSAVWRRQTARLQIARLLVALAAADEERVAVETLIAIGDDAFDVAEAMARTGSASAASLASIQLKLLRWRERMSSIESTVDEFEGRIATVLQLPRESIESALATEFVRQLDGMPRALAVSIPSEHPQLHAIEASARSASLQAEAAVAGNRPDYTFWLSWSWIDGSRVNEAMAPRAGRDTLMAGVAIGLPIDRATTSRRAEASRSQSRMLLLEQEQSLRDLEEALHTLSATVSDRYRRAHAWAYEALSLSDERIESEIDAAATGNGDFANIYQALEDHEELVLEAVALRRDARLALVELTTLTNGNGGAVGLLPVETCDGAQATNGAAGSNRVSRSVDRAERGLQ